MHRPSIFVCFCSVLLMSFTLFAMPHSVAAVEIDVLGLYQCRPFAWAQRNLRKGHADDRMRASTRLRTQIQLIASENLRGVFSFRLGHQNWGVGAQGGSLGTDKPMISIHRSYLDWRIPHTETRVRMGLQPFELPAFTGTYPVFKENAAGLVVSHEFNENVAGTLFWSRMENDNTTIAQEWGEAYAPHDAMDFAGFMLPVKTDTLRVTPWAMYGLVGQNSLKNAGLRGVFPQIGILPLGANATLAGTSDEPRGQAWYAGFATQWKLLQNLTLALDAGYGTVDMGKAELHGRDFDLQRSGWYATLRGDYKMAFGTPGVVCWYASGDDGDPYNGSERLPSLYPNVALSSFGFGYTMHGGSANTLGFSLAGSWGAMFRLNKMSFYEDLTHTFRVLYMQGTNNREMVRQGFIKDPQQTVSCMAYLTSSDKVVEVNFDTNYRLSHDFYVSVELGYIRMQQDADLWRKVGYEANKNNYKTTLSFNYKF